MLSNWIFEGKEIDDSVIEKYSGFVYLITNKTNGRRYIGKKLFKFTRTKKIKGKRKKTIKESDWKSYYGSNKELIEDVKLLGAESFTREILKLCKTKGTANYYEAKYQMEYKVLESSEFYNDQIRVRVHRSHIKE